MAPRLIASRRLLSSLLTVSLTPLALAAIGCDAPEPTNTPEPAQAAEAPAEAAPTAEPETEKKEPAKADVPPVGQILTQFRECSPTIAIRSQQLTEPELDAACKLMEEEEAFFHKMFGTKAKPVADDYNVQLTANVYNSREDYEKYVTAHFDVPTGNGGMYLEGFPHDKSSQANFVAYEREQGKVWNLGHEYVHYLDGRFNTHGDYCKTLHDDHSGPEYCPKPDPALPHQVWWTEGLGEYVAHQFDGDPKRAFYWIMDNEERLTLSELFNTSYNKDGGGLRIYGWGHLAVRFMMENHRPEVDKMLAIMRAGDQDKYRALVNGWGTKFDAQFDKWYNGIMAKLPPKQKNDKKKGH